MAIQFDRLYRLTMSNASWQSSIRLHAWRVCVMSIWIFVALRHTDMLRAQTISGRIFLPDGSTPAGSIAVSATAAGGLLVARELSAPSGAYSLRLPSPGEYEVRAVRIGFRPTIIQVTMSAGSDITRDITL